MPKIIIVCGSPGSGKTTYSKRLALSRGATVLDIDTVSERLVKVGLSESGHSPDDRDSDHFKRTYRDPIYEALFDIARDNIAIHDVIIAGPFTKELQDTEWISKLSSRFGCPVEVHYVQCPPEIRKQRLAARGDARDRAKLEDWDRYVSYYGDEHPPVFEHTLVNGVSEK